MTSQEPIIKSFAIHGLHGYKSLYLDFQNRTRIVIAENGTGKTTFLSALNAFLLGNFSQIANLAFSEIECRLGASSQAIRLRREQLLPLGSPQPQSKLRELAQYASVAPPVLTDFLNTHVRSRPFTEINDHPIVARIFFDSPYSMEEVDVQLKQALVELDQSYPDELKALSGQIAEGIGDCEILYLPTYRRVELPLARREHRGAGPRVPRPRQSQLERDLAGRLADMRFGLTDVEDRLREMTDDIQRRSNAGYRVISGTIIDDLLEAKLSAKVDDKTLPDIEALRLFFSRLSGEQASARRLSALAHLYENNEIHKQQYETLRFFLLRLARVVSQTRETETNLEKFVEQVNVYLQQSSDEKQIFYDPQKMRVHVRNLWTGKDVGLDDLSSGEKQVISLFSRLYLYPRKKIVLIDEPELSLSIDWQKRLLPDIASSPSCAQLLAITHSPFIFDNEMEPLAGPLEVTRTKL